VRVMLAADYTGPGSGLEGTGTDSGTTDVSGDSIDTSAASGETATPPPSPVITAGADDPKCVN